MVPLVFYTMLRRWTTRRSEEKWPHRPLAGDEDTDEEQDDVVADLAEIMVSSEGDTARQIEVGAVRARLTQQSRDHGSATGDGITPVQAKFRSVAAAASHCLVALLRTVVSLARLPAVAPVAVFPVLVVDNTVVSTQPEKMHMVGWVFWTCVSSPCSWRWQGSRSCLRPASRTAS